MRALTTKQPWAYLITEGIKDIENRSWKTNYRGRILIHTSMDQSLDKIPLDMVFNKHQLAHLLSIKSEYSLISRIGPFGKIIGSVDLVDCVKGHKSIWAEKTTYNWVLANPHVFPEEISAKGSLGLWDYPNICAEPEETNGSLFCHCQLPISDFAQVMNCGAQNICRYCGEIWYR